MKALSITLKDLQILLKDRGSLFQYFLLPLLFVLIFSGALGSIGSSTRGYTPGAGGRQPGRRLSRRKRCWTGLDAAGGVRTELYDQAKAETLLDKNELGRVLFIPADFSAGLSAGQPGDPAPGRPSGCQRRSRPRPCCWWWRAWRAT